MRKYFLIFTALFLLSACNEEKKATKVTSNSSTVSTSSRHRETVQESVKEKTTVSTSNSMKETETKKTEFEEMDKFVEKTNFSGTPEVVEDNNNKRIILWKKNTRCDTKQFI